MEKILIGTSGYDYPEWKGIFYSPEVKRADFLYYYATQFNAVELNNKFYNMPTAEQLFSFYERSEGKLQFSIKVNRLLTHEIDSQWESAADDFKAALKTLLEKDSLSTVLFQFPQSFHYTNENRVYLAKMISAFEGFSVVIEFRHKEWIRESVFEGLVQRKASVAFCDMPMCRKAQTSIISNYANGAKATYSVGPEQNGSGRYDYEYSEGELKEFVPVVHVAMEEGRKVQVYFNTIRNPQAMPVVRKRVLHGH